MSLEEFRQAYPGSQELPPLPDAKGDGRGRRFVVWKANDNILPGPVDLEFRFWNGRLWMILVYANDLPAHEMQAALERRFGPPPISGEKPSWLWPSTKLVSEPAKRWLAIFDRRLASQVQEATFAPSPIPQRHRNRK